MTGVEVEPLAPPEVPPGRPRLVVTGFMGTGKTEAGARAAAALGLPFVDLDAVVEERTGRTVEELFRERGEAAFRELERRAVADAARLSGAVIATGGGAPLDGGFAQLAAGAVVAVLRAEPSAVASRAGAGRPLLGPRPGESRIAALMAERAAAYRDAGRGSAATVTINTTRAAPEEVAARIEAAYRGAVPDVGTTRIDVPVPGGTSTVVVGRGSLSLLGDELAALLPEARRAAIVADPAVSHVADAVAGAVRSAGLEPCRAAVASGEAAKDASTLARLWSTFRSAGLDPGDVVIAVGGGATTDVAGFAAATYARGVALVNVPTTVLGMADAAIGGKVGIDHAGVKNVAGTFHFARLVVCDPGTVATLPERDRRAGLAEVAKVAVLASPLLLERLGAEEDVTWAVEQAGRVKAGYVALDPFDRGPRHALNLGHTFGHAIEAAAGLAIRHGEAVAMGLRGAARLGTRHGVTDASTEPRVLAALQRLGLPTTPPPGLDPARIREALGADKKRRAGRSAFVVPAPEGAALLRGVDAGEALDCLLAQEAVPR